MYEIYSFCRDVDDIADNDGPRDVRLAQLQRWRHDVDAVYAGAAPPQLHALAEAIRTFDLSRDDFRAVIDGMEMDVIAPIRAPDWATLDLYCDRVASAVGRLCVRVFKMDEAQGKALAHHLGRALQLTNILRDIDEDAGIGRLYLPQEALSAAGITSTEPLRGHRQSCDRSRLRPRRRACERPFCRVRRDPRPKPAPGRAHAPRHERGLSLDPRASRRAWLCSAARARQTAPHATHLDCSVSRHRLTPRQIHVVGAGLAGLSAAVRLSSRGLAVTVHEATNQAGGRCRSYYDATLGMEIDNGNHLVLSGNTAALSYLDIIGARAGLDGPPSASFPFVDLATGERWTVSANDGPIPWWILVPSRRVPGARLSEYFALAKLLRAKAGATIGETISCSGPLYQRLIEPLLIAALNTEPRSGSAALAAAIIRETLAAGGRRLSPVDRSQWSFQCFRRAGAALHRRPWRQRELWSPASSACVRRRPRDGARLRRRVHSIDVKRRRRPRRAVDGRAVSRARLVGADGISRHRQRAFPHRSAGGPSADDRRRQRHDAMAFRVPRTPVGHHQRRGRSAEPVAGGSRADGSGGKSPQSPSSRTPCRRGKSCANVARRSRLCRERTPSAPSRRRPGKTSSSRATGPGPGCPRPSRARSAPAPKPRTQFLRLEA